MRYFSFVNSFASMNSLSLFQLKNLDVYVWYFLSGTWHTPGWISSRKLQSPEISLFLDKVFMCINKCNCSTFLITFFFSRFFACFSDLTWFFLKILFHLLCHNYILFASSENGHLNSFVYLLLNCTAGMKGWQSWPYRWQSCLHTSRLHCLQAKGNGKE